MKKFTLLLVMLLGVLGVKATELDLDLDNLDGGTYNKSTHVFSCPSESWSENQWWVATWDGSKNVDTDYSAYDELILEYITSDTQKFRVYFATVAGITTQTVYPTSNAQFGRSVIKLNSSTKSGIGKIILSGAGNALTMKLTRAYFRSKSNKSTTSLWTGSENFGDSWGKVNALTYDNRGNLANAKVDDIIQVTITNTTEGNQINVTDAYETTFVDGCFDNVTAQEEAQTIEYVIPNAIVAEKIQQSGIVINGKKVTVTKIELITYNESYDAVYFAIGADEIATFSTSNKSLDFSGSVVTPYYASEVTKGSVTLKSVRYTRGWQGYILKGVEGKYELKVVETEEDYPSQNYLKPIGDYSGVVKYSQNEDTKYRYIFAKDSDSNIGFYKLTENNHTLAAHKAYLETDDDLTPSAPSARVALIFDDEETTGVSEVRSLKSEVKSEYYDLMGRKVAHPTHGLYIVNGKKVLIK